MQPLKLSDFAARSDSHATCAMVGGMLVLTGIALGMTLAQDGKALQGEIHQDRIPRPASPSSPDLTAMIAGEILKLLK